MKKLITIAAAITLLFVASSFALLLTNWNLDPNYSIKFSGGKAEGTFSGLSGKVSFSPDDLAHSTIAVSLDANTIKTGNNTKDEHAKGESWFDTETFPQIKFTSSSFKKNGNQFIVIGVLELHGVTKEIQIPFNFSENNGKGEFTGEFKIDRKDYGIKGNSMGFMVGKEFVITLKVPVSKQ